MRTLHCSDMEPSNSGGYPKTRGLLRWKSGEAVDPRLLALLELLQELYVKRQEFFKKIFPGDHEDLFRKLGGAILKKKERRMRRSQSIGPVYAVKGRGLDGDGTDDFKAERFKVKTPIVVVEDGQGQNVQLLGDRSTVNSINVN